MVGHTTPPAGWLARHWSPKPAAENTRARELFPGASVLRSEI